MLNLQDLSLSITLCI
ncbi:putative RNA-directed DNA polymerase from transposon BS, partial [Araneus ventricosus]